jgi:small subunit ribosomal protein S27e
MQQQKIEPKFVEIECPDCKTRIVTYVYASSVVKCPKCGRVLVEPSGGKAKIHGKIVKWIVWKE